MSATCPPHPDGHPCQIPEDTPHDHHKHTVPSDLKPGWCTVYIWTARTIQNLLIVRDSKRNKETVTPL